MKFYGIPIAILIAVVLISPVIAAESQEPVNTAGPLNQKGVEQEPFSSAGALYSQSVDLAGEGKYQEALDAADKALAMNVTSLNGVIQSNRAGILVMLHRNTEAITAADAALAVEGNLTTVHSIAWYNKGNALRALGRITEAQVAYDHAFLLDNTLVPPDMSSDILRSDTLPAATTLPLTINQPTPLRVQTPAAATTQRSPLPAVAGVTAVVLAVLICARAGKPF